MLTQPAYWTKEMPAYHTVKGWEFEKAITLEIIKLRFRLHKLDTMLNKAELLFKAAFQAKDTYTLLRYERITTILYRWHMAVAERLIFDYKQVL